MKIKHKKKRSEIKKAILVIEKTLKKSPNNVILLWTLENLNSDLIQTTDDGTERTVAIEANLEINERIISLISEHEAETEKGIFPSLADILCRAYNSRAMYKFERAINHADLEKALTDINRCIYFLRFVTRQSPIPYYLETKIRILLKIGDNDKAYFLTNEALKLLPDFADLKDVYGTKEFQNWKKNDAKKQRQQKKKRS